MSVSIWQHTIQAYSLDGPTRMEPLVILLLLIECGSVVGALEIHLALVTRVQEGIIISLGKF